MWNEFCDWYLELSKPVLWDKSHDPAEANGTRKTLLEVLEQVLRMMHPFMPFLTEEIWQIVSPITGKPAESIMLAPWPTQEAGHLDSAAEAEIEWLKGVIIAIRTIRSEANIPPATELELYLANTTERDRERLETNAAFLSKLAKVAHINVLCAAEAPPPSLMALYGELEIRVPMAGVVDVESELARLDKEIGKITSEIDRLDKKLSNQGFTEKAPAEVVSAERDKLQQASLSLATLKQQRTQIEELRSA
jgi:valyl-tRNA synthetase